MGEYIEYVNQGFRILLKVLAPYVAQELKRHYKKDWWREGVLNVLKEHQSRDLPLDGDWAELVDSLDILRCLQLIDYQWQTVFRVKMTIDHRNWIKELIATRNKIAHLGSADLKDEDAWRAIDTMVRLCEQIDAESTDELRAIARKIRYGTTDPSTSLQSFQANSEKGLKEAGTIGVLHNISFQNCKPWRDIIEPHPDVARGEYLNAEFAADLNQVAKGRGAIEYRDPVEFFARTYMTEGLKALLESALRRVGNKGGDPVIQLKTVFGGGKTHSMLALYHLLRGQVPLRKIDEYVRPVLDAAGLDSLVKARVAVIVGTALDPSKSRRPATMRGITINTLWGEIAAQLAESAGDLSLYNIVRDADKKGVSPGSEAFRYLFDQCGPCLILIDELVAYAKKLYGQTDLPAGTFDNFVTFIQEICEGVRASKNSLLVVSLPESDLEIGGEAGQKILEILEHVFGRMETIWKPVSSTEGFEVVRRRLFLKPKDPDALEQVCKAFSELYRHNSQDFPSECREASYYDRMISCYPIHPEVFDRLYHDWATLERFQRTRGVLRLMAAVIHELWMQQDHSMMILPSSFTLSSPAVRSELTRHLSEGWNGIIEKEVDGPSSIPYILEQENTRFSKYLAARRTARTILLGSAPSVREQKVRGIEVNRILLGTVQPGENLSVFNDALTHLRERSTYLYSNASNSRYWYDTRPTLNRIASDRSSQYSEDEIEYEIVKRLKSSCQKDRFMGIHVCPANSMNIPDEQQVRLVILSPAYPHKQNQPDSKAEDFISNAIHFRGDFPRMHQNMLAFVASDGKSLKDLEKVIRSELAWESIIKEKTDLNLDQSQIRESEDNLEKMKNLTAACIKETYCWLFIPKQVGTQPIEWDVERLSNGSESITSRAFNQMVQKDNLITNWNPFLLKREMDNYFWTDKNHIAINEIWDYLTKYCYLPRLLNKDVLINTIKTGLESDEYFAYADGFDGKKYLGLRLSQGIGQSGDRGLLVKVDVARAQLKAVESSVPAVDEKPSFEVTDNGSFKEKPSLTRSASVTSMKKRFHASIPLDKDRLAARVGKINDEVLQHLTLLDGADSEITLEINVQVPQGIPENIVRTVTENAQTLRIENATFEEE
ncbi:MAG: DUF499 domain-containing protein [Clostridia bacterium]|nr:DUF499 domain-containing protein [Clostridia bacterium]